MAIEGDGGPVRLIGQCFPDRGSVSRCFSATRGCTLSYCMKIDSSCSSSPAEVDMLVAAHSSLDSRRIFLKPLLLLLQLSLVSFSVQRIVVAVVLHNPLLIVISWILVHGCSTRDWTRKLRPDLRSTRLYLMVIMPCCLQVVPHCIRYPRHNGQPG